MWFVKLIGTIFSWFSGVNLSSVVTGFVEVLKNKTNADVANHAADNQAGSALATTYLQSQAQLNQVKLESRRIEGKWGPTLITTLLFFTIPIGVHFSAIVFDSMPLFGHVVGTWHIEKLPKPFDELEINVIGSLFYIGGGVGAVSMLAKAFMRR